MEIHPVTKIEAIEPRLGRILTVRSALRDFSLLISPAQNLPAQAVSGSQRYAHADFAERLTWNWQDNRRKPRGRGIERGLLTDRFESSDRCVERVLRSKALGTKSGKP